MVEALREPPLTFPPDAIDWACGKLKPLLRRRGAPTGRVEQEAYAASVLRIAHPALVELRVKYQDREIPEGKIAEALGAPKAALEKTRIAGENPLDWLVMTADDEALFFVEPVDLRGIFIEKYPCADGRTKFTPRGGKEFKKK